MKTAFLFGALVASTAASPAVLPPTTHTTVAQHMRAVNAQWNVQDPFAGASQQAIAFASEAERIALHLHLVREQLAARNVSDLSAAQRAEREQLIGKLQVYADRGIFPKNEVLSYRNPVFIDHYGTACAVGQLIIESGHRDLSERISKEMNLAYVLDMPSSQLWPEIGAWANEHGFTAEELAWIQPTYPPNLPWAPLGGGTNGTVRVVKKLNNGDVLVAGEFTEAGGTPANGVAIWNGTNYVALGTGAEGLVNCAVEMNGELYLGGSEFPGFNDLAKWDGAYWTFSMVFQGKYPLINALHVHNNTLFAAGATSGFAGITDYVQRLDGTVWSPVGSAFDAPVHALATHNGVLVAGGAFTTIQTPTLPPPALHVAELDGNEWGQHGDGLDATVRTLLDVNGTLYAGGDLYANIVVTFGLARIGQGAATWEHLLPNHASYMPDGAGPSWIGSLAERDGSIYFGGAFYVYTWSELGSHIARWDGIDLVTPLAVPELPVRAIAVSGTNLTLGGEFEVWQPHVCTLDLTTGIDAPLNVQFTLSPNPVTDVLRLTLPDVDLTHARMTITDASGRMVAVPVKRGTENMTIDVRNLPAGAYQVRIEEGNATGVQRFVKQ